jgi:hypothetical protein
MRVKPRDSLATPPAAAYCPVVSFLNIKFSKKKLRTGSIVRAGYDTITLGVMANIKLHAQTSDLCLRDSSNHEVTGHSNQNC